MEVKGMGFELIALLLKEKNNVLSPSRRACMYMVFVSLEHVIFLLPVMACEANITARPSQNDILYAFLYTTEGHASYPEHSDKITSEVQLAR